MDAKTKRYAEYKDFLGRCNLAECKHQAGKTLLSLAMQCESEAGIDILADAAFYLSTGRLPNVERRLS